QKGPEGQEGQKRGYVKQGLRVKKTKRTTKAHMAHPKKSGLEAAPAILREFVFDASSAPAAPSAPPAPGSVITVAIFQPGEFVKVAGTTKGRGFQGVVKRYGFGGGPATHGNTRHRKPGSVGAGTDPSRVIRGKRMPGHMGAERHTEVGLRVVKVDPERHLLFVRGAVPGPAQGTVEVRKQGGRGRYA
ncbi:MAG: 50S ribosomal protein L3, partial [Gemmatimonadetes bacterium]|nr:50S ribosomal protein L3 [Gemmatimonadota bacterium]